MELASGDIESAGNLNHCKEAVGQLLNTFLTEGTKKTDKVSKAQDIVDQAKKLMGDNVKKMIDNQKDFGVRLWLKVSNSFILLL